MTARERTPRVKTQAQSQKVVHVRRRDDERPTSERSERPERHERFVFLLIINMA